jgi:hypothetical protein
MTWMWRAAACIALVVVAMLALWDVPKRPQNPMGCDSFGYQRQASLFRDNGLAGIRTALRIPPSGTLLEAARSSGFRINEWHEMVAPHCHHYVAATRDVILQYPPGTGALLSLFPEPVEERALAITSVALIAIGFVGLICLAREPLPILPASLAGAASIWVTSIDFGSPSIYPAAAFSFVIGVLTIQIFRRPSLWIAALLGLLIGLSAAVRLSNILLCVGTFVMLLMMLARQRRPVWIWLSGAMALGVIAGTIPVLSANAVNAGSVFATTYSSSDAELPSLSVEQLMRAAAFYFRPNPASALLTLALGASVVGIIRRRTDAAIGAAGITLVTCLLFFLTKEVLIVYYLIPTAVFCLSAAATDWIMPSTDTGSAGQRSVAIGAIVLAALCFLWVFTRMPYPERDDKIDAEVAAQLRTEPMIWADSHGGFFVTFNRVYAAKLMFAAPDVQKEIVAALADRHIPQLFLDESPEMKKSLARLSTQWRFDLLGKAYGQNVYALAGPALPDQSRP